MTINILVLGGTTEGRQLAARLAADPRFHAVLSLAGRTAEPAPAGIPTRFGGFGGAEGLRNYIAENGIRALIVATHPFAAEIARNAAVAVAAAGIDAIRLVRPAWERRDGDDWRLFADLPALVAGLGAEPKRVFVTVGRQEAARFERAPQHHYLFRSIEPIAPLALPNAEYVRARGPFSVAGEVALMTQHRIERLVAKQSGGEATYAKIEAARRLAIPVCLVERPPPTAMAEVGTVAAAIALLEALYERCERGA